VCHGGIEPLLEKLFDKFRITGDAQLPRRLLGAYGESGREQGVDSQCGGMWTSPLGPPLMIIECLEQTLITRVHWGETQGSGDGKAEKSGHLIVDHCSTHCVDLSRRQYIQQGRASDKALIAVAAGQEPSERLDAAVDDHCVSRQRHPTADRRIMIKMDPALSRGKAWCQPSLVGTCPRTKINDLECIPAINGFDQIVDQLGEERADGGGSGRGVGGGAGGEPARVDDRFGRRSR
jgi:hypothetical protein